jgi:hypothetical protein
MVLGQSAATAAVLALDGKTSVQKVDYAALGKRLLDDGQVLQWTGPARARAGIDPKTLPGVVVDDGDAKIEGEWTSGTSLPRFVGSAYLHDGDADKGKKSVRFIARLPRSGRYEVRLAYTASGNRAENVPVAIEHAGGPERVSVNQKTPPPIAETFISLGTFSFTADRPAVVTVSTEGTRGHVIADAAVFVPVP